MRCQHYSRGCIAPRFFAQLEYLQKKYPKYEAFGVTGYYIGAGRTFVRRFQKRVRSFMDKHFPQFVLMLQKFV
jgi:hypothetical protein